MQSRTPISPPRARLAFRVGVVGHRPDRLPHDPRSLEILRGVIRLVLAEVKAAVLSLKSSEPQASLYAEEAPILRAVSPLAEGTDRIFAEEALNLGYELCSPMPFAQEEFEKDFLPGVALEPNSLQQFRDLLRRAKAGQGLVTFELDGDRGETESAYGAAGRVVLNQSDLMMLVWDGGKPAGGGGTVQTLREAVLYGVPVLWIDAVAPHAWQLLQREADLECLKGEERCIPTGPSLTGSAENRERIAHMIERLVRDELALAGAEDVSSSGPQRTNSPGSVPPSRAEEYFAEHRPRFHPHFLWKLFRDAVGSGRFTIQRFTLRAFESESRAEWPTNGDPDSRGKKTAGVPERPSMLADWVNRRLRAHYAWSDKLADLYADKYRSAYVRAYLLSALAVFVALVPTAAGWDDAREQALIATEFVILVIILITLLWGRRLHWHDRWMEYRLLAELIRQLRFLIPLGGGRPTPRVPAQLAVYGDPRQTWMYWHVRAIARSTGLPQAKVDPNYVRDYLDYLAHVVGTQTGGQWHFHAVSEARARRINERLHHASLSLFFLTILAIALHLFLPLGGAFTAHVEEVVAPWLVLLSATLPALGAALAGINNQGEFARIAKRSRAMASGFEKFAARVAALRGESEPKLRDVIPLAYAIAEAMVEEVVDWRVVFIDRPQAAV